LIGGAAAFVGMATVLGVALGNLFTGLLPIRSELVVGCRLGEILFLQVTLDYILMWSIRETFDKLKVLGWEVAI